MDLFDYNFQQNKNAVQPHGGTHARPHVEGIHRAGAHRFGNEPAFPRHPHGPLGQLHFLGTALGTGKTTLANIVANSTGGNYVKLNAVNAGIADVKAAVERARSDLKMYGKRTYLLLDECHRFNKAQSDSLLPAIEPGDIIFIGSTTENPYAGSMTPAIVSRCRVFEFKALSEKNILGALKKAAADKERGLGNMLLEVDEAAFSHFAAMAAGDLRVAYNALELAALTTAKGEDGAVHVTLKDAEESSKESPFLRREPVLRHAFGVRKSLRGSDPTRRFITCTV